MVSASLISPRQDRLLSWRVEVGHREIHNRPGGTMSAGAYYCQNSFSSFLLPFARLTRRDHGPFGVVLGPV